MSTKKGKNSLPSLATLFARADGYADAATGGVVPPVQPSSTYIRDENYQLVSASHLYGRDDNDLLRLGETILAKAEQGEAGLLLPSGMAAIAAVIRTLQAGDHLVLQSGIYWGTTKWIREFCARRSVQLTEVDAASPEALSEAISSARPALVFIETPSNPWLAITGIAATARACARAGAVLVVDSTAATPALSNPLTLGADIVMHSASKAINGHSDVLAGFLGARDAGSALWQAICADRHDAGALLGPFEAWLLIRGMRTLELRMQRMCDNAQKVAEFLHGHQRVTKVLYPGLPSHPGHALAKDQMPGGFGALMSFLIDGDGKTALEFCSKLRLFHRATSLGGVESLAEHRHSIEGDATGIPPSLVRLSIGIEDAGELIEDLREALEK